MTPWPALRSVGLSCAAALLAVAVPAGAGATGAAQGAQAATCKYEENCGCRVPGVTARWKAAYCMYLNATDDLEQEGVQTCLARRDTDPPPRTGACAQNAHWKLLLCQEARGRQHARRCLDDRTFMPRIVEQGPGS